MTLPRDDLREALEAFTEDEWQELCEKADRTSPSEYPDMVLLRFDELQGIVERSRAALSSSPPEAKGEQVAWRWRPLGGETWIYDPAPEWLESQGDAIEKQPLYAAPSLPPSPPDGTVGELVAKLRAVDHASVEDCFLQSPLFSQAADAIEMVWLRAQNLEEACEKLASVRSQKTYLAMIEDEGATDALLELDAARKAVQALRLAAHLRSQAGTVGAWQPIETAPKDGTRVLLADAKNVVTGTWGKDWSGQILSWRCDWLVGEHGDQPTHWQPLPAPPALAAAPAQEAREP